MSKKTTSGLGRRLMDPELQHFTPQRDIEFPDPRDVEGDVVAIGGDLSSEMLLSAYRRGIFPWYSHEEPILWWSLDPRFVVFPTRIHVSKSLRKTIRRDVFRLTLDKSFNQIIAGCRKSVRLGQGGTWITDDMMEAYIRLHALGYAHSVEAWINGEVVGGLYGVSLGGCFYGESMFTTVSDASKVAFVGLVGVLIDAGFGLIDCQQHTRHLRSFGGIDMPRQHFLEILKRELGKPTHMGDWSLHFPEFPSSTLWQNLNRRDSIG